MKRRVYIDTDTSAYRKQVSKACRKPASLKKIRKAQAKKSRAFNDKYDRNRDLMEVAYQGGSFSSK